MEKDKYYDPMEAYWHNYHNARYGLKKDDYTIREIKVQPLSFKHQEGSKIQHFRV
jgi:hypothetical protein